MHIMCTVKSIWLRGFFFLAAIVAPLLLATAQAPGTSAPPAAHKTVVVELFTAEGCSSCPPADDLLARLRQVKPDDGLEIIPLGLHVDYWNSQGWIDKFSSAAYTERQQTYAQKFKIEGPYTPQMVVDGATEFVGNDAAHARQAIIEAARRPSQAEVQIASVAGDRLQVRIKAEESVSGEVMLAMTEDNLSSKVRAGENDGKELHHAAVVRELRSLGRLRNGGFEADLHLKIQKGWKRQDLRVVVFVQEPRNGKMEGAAAIPLAETLTSAQ
jgi:hypothetical protein